MACSYILVGTYLLMLVSVANIRVLELRQTSSEWVIHCIRSTYSGVIEIIKCRIFSIQLFSYLTFSIHYAVLDTILTPDNHVKQTCSISYMHKYSSHYHINVLYSKIWKKMLLRVKYHWNWDSVFISFKCKLYCNFLF